MPTYTEPTWGKAQNIDKDCSSIVNTGPTPFILSGVLRRILQAHFADSSNIANPLLKNRPVWTPYGCDADENAGETPSGWVIETSYADLDLGDIEQFPAIFIKRNNVAIGGISIDDKSIDGFNANGLFEGPNYTQLFQGSHSLVCVGKTGAEAESIGSEVLFRLLHYIKVIKKEFCLSSLSIPQMAPPAKVPKGKDAFQVTITVKWVWMYRWLVTEEAPLLKRLIMNSENIT